MFKYLILSTIILTACTVEPNKKGYARDLEGTNLSLYGKNNLEYRKRVVVVDTGLNEYILSRDYMCGDVASLSTQKTHRDYDGHGTNIVSIIAATMDSEKYCITMLRVLVGEKRYAGMMDGGFANIKYLNRNLYAVNISLIGFIYDHDSFKTFKKLAETGVQISSAAGNDGQDIGKKCVIFPACYNKLIKSPNFKSIGALQDYSNYGSSVDIFIHGGPRGTYNYQGTSQATALYTSYLVK